MVVLLVITQIGAAVMLEGIFATLVSILVMDMLVDTIPDITPPLAPLPVVVVLEHPTKVLYSKSSFLWVMCEILMLCDCCFSWYFTL